MSDINKDIILQFVLFYYFIIEPCREKKMLTPEILSFRVLCTARVVLSKETRCACNTKIGILKEYHC